MVYMAVDPLMQEKKVTYSKINYRVIYLL